MEGSEKEVYYDQYCPSCKYLSSRVDATEDGEISTVCNDCLNECYNIDSHKPVKYEKK